MALNLDNFLNTLVDCLENYNNVTYTRQHKVQVSVYGRVANSGTITLTLAGESQQSFNVSEGTTLGDVVNWIGGIRTTNYDTDKSGNIVTFSQKPSKQTISDDYKNYGVKDIYSNLGQTTYDSGGTGVILVVIEQNGYKCDYDQNMEFGRKIGEEPALDEDGKPILDEEGNPQMNPVYQTSTDTIRNVMIDAMTEFYQKIFDAILELSTTVTGVIAKALTAGPVKSESFTASPPSNASTVFKENLAKVDFGRRGKLSKEHRDKAKASATAFANALSAWFTAQVYTLPSHNATPTTSTTYGYTYGGKNLGEVVLDVSDFNGITLSTLILTNLELIGTDAGNQMKPYMDLICSVLAKHINDNWKYGFSSGQISYTGTVLPSGSLTPPATGTGTTNINE